MRKWLAVVVMVVMGLVPALVIANGDDEGNGNGNGGNNQSQGQGQSQAQY